MNRITYTFLTISIFLFIIAACSNEVNTEEPKATTEEEVTDTLVESSIDSEEIGEEIDVEKTPENYENPDTQEAAEFIVEEYGEQWDFCTCIQKQDSVNNALMEAEGEVFDRVMERSDFIDLKCKELMIQPNTTPEERAKHQKRIKDCLEQ